MGVWVDTPKKCYLSGGNCLLACGFDGILYYYIQSMGLLLGGSRAYYGKRPWRDKLDTRDYDVAIEGILKAGQLLEKRNEDNYASVIELLADIDPCRLTQPDICRFKAIVDKLPDEVIYKSIDICYLMCRIELRNASVSNNGKVNEWYEALTSLRREYKTGTKMRGKLENRIHCVQVIMPQVSGAIILFHLAALAHELNGNAAKGARLSPTGERPSILRGSKDFSEHTRFYTATAGMLEAQLPAFLYDNGKDVIAGAQAEILYECNDLAGAAMYVAPLFNTADPDTAFAVLATAARLGAADPSIMSYRDILKYMAKTLEEKDARWLKHNHEAFEVHFAILEGDMQAVEAWLEKNSSNALEEPNSLNFYQMFTEARARIATQEPLTAMVLLKKLDSYFDWKRRTLDKIEGLVLSAVCYSQLKREYDAEAAMVEAVKLSQNYGYVRVFADCGGLALQVLKAVKNDLKTYPDVDAHHLEKLIDAARQFAVQYPRLFAPEVKPVEAVALGRETFTEQETQVLNLLARGKSNKAIAGELFISASTVKFHISNIMNKTNASNRYEAVNTVHSWGVV
jgi:DNA-binding CsgD family transcriptional regulator